jgi:hypothetical protein
MEDDPDRLQARIEAMREEQDARPSGDPSLGHAIALFMSMGFSFAGCLVAALLFGDYLVKRTGQQSWYIVMLVVGLVSGGAVVVQLLRPLLRSNAR